MQNLLKTLEQVLQKDDRLVIDGILAKNKIMELALALDASLLKLILSDKSLKDHFFTEVDKTLVFDKQEFIRFVNNKNFLPDSYTSFKNKIGLMNEDGTYMSQSKDVVLVFPYKDCVLEGGQDKEDAKRKEIFWNTTLAPDEIDRLLDPKVFTNFKKYDKNGEKEVKAGEVGFENENLIIKGNNLLALHSLERRYAGKVKLIYIDPPYNPESDSNTFCYNNSFNESTWLTFMKNRLEVAKKLLTKDGVFIVAIDKNEHMELGVLLKEIFTEHELHCITIVHNPRGVQGSNFSYTHEYAIFLIPKGSKTIGNRKISDEEIDWSPLRNWGGESRREDAKNCFYPIIIRDEKIVDFGDVLDEEKHPTAQTEQKGENYYIWPIDKNGVERKWRYARQSVGDVKHLLRVKKSKTGFEIEIGKDFGSFKTVWIDPRYDANEYGTELVKSLVPDCKFDFPKSLYNVYDAIYAVVANDPNAIVLDYHAGSGTTAHAVLDLNKEDEGNRKFILVEQMDYIETVTAPRVAAVIKKDNLETDFIYCELQQLNQSFVDAIQSAKSTKELLKIWENMQKQGFLSYRLDAKVLEDNAEEFKKMTLEEQQKILLSVLDHNHLYVNYSEMEDADYAVSDKDKALNTSFYTAS